MEYVTPKKYPRTPKGKTGTSIYNRWKQSQQSLFHGEGDSSSGKDAGKNPGKRTPLMALKKKLNLTATKMKDRKIDTSKFKNVLNRHRDCFARLSERNCRINIELEKLDQNVVYIQENSEVFI